jgi:hypothetical protein
MGETPGTVAGWGKDERNTQSAGRIVGREPTRPLPPFGVDMTADLNHFYAYGDVYDALAACDELEMLLNRLKRQGMLTDQQWKDIKAHMACIRIRIEGTAAA